MDIIELKRNSELKTAVYIRVSTEDQAHKGHSLDEQLDRIKENCKYNHYNIAKVFREDGKSAKDMKGRPEFLKMIKGVIDGKYNNIVIYKLDRLTRSIRDLEEILTLCEEHNCNLVSVTEDINTSTAFGKFFIRLVILLAQLEVEQTRERTIMGLVGTVKQGIPIGRIPLGYKRDETNPDPKLKKRAIINEEEAKTVRKIFDWYLKGYSFYYIAQMLIEEGNTQMQWKDWAIQKIITNRLYCGDIEHRKSLKDKDTIIYENVVPPIISREVFNDCQSMIEKNKHSFGGSLDYMFGKTLYCNKCGSLLGVSPAKNKGIKYYVCRQCGYNLNEHKIEKEVMEKLGDITQFNLAVTYNAILVENEKLTQILDNINLSAPDERLKTRKNELRDMLDDIVIYQMEHKDNTKNKLWQDLNYEEKRNLISSIIDKIYIEKIKGKTQQDYKIKVKRIEFKKSHIDKIFELRQKGLIDSYGINGNNVWSLAQIDDEKEIQDYLARLRKRYNIKVDEIYLRGDEYKSKKKSKELDDLIENVVYNSKCFKTIKVSRRNELLKGKFEKERHIHISLV